ncbi:MAG: MMPL family transporter, partial [Campylobacterales bacterium]|nr:MMPL family transporter [Campylobacterales bacterium]
MEKYLDFLDRFKIAIVPLTTLCVFALSISLKDIGYEGSYRIWFDKDSKIIKEYDAFRNTFSGDDSFIISFQDENEIFNPKPIEMILKLTEKFETLEGVQKVNSLTNYQHISSKNDDFRVDDFITDTEDLVEKKEIALEDELLVNNLISKDGTTTLLSVKLSESSGADEDLNIRLMKTIQEILQEEEELTGYKFYLSGAPAITASLVTIS